MCMLLVNVHSPWHSAVSFALALYLMFVFRRYKALRDNNGNYSLFYWELLAVRLGFIIAFEVWRELLRHCVRSFVSFFLSLYSFYLSPSSLRASVPRLTLEVLLIKTSMNFFGGVQFYMFILLLLFDTFTIPLLHSTPITGPIFFKCVYVQSVASFSAPSTLIYPFKTSEWWNLQICPAIPPSSPHFRCLHFWY